MSVLTRVKSTIFSVAVLYFLSLLPRVEKVSLSADPRRERWTERERDYTKVYDDTSLYRKSVFLRGRKSLFLSSVAPFFQYRSSDRTLSTLSLVPRLGVTGVYCPRSGYGP